MGHLIDRVIWDSSKPLLQTAATRDISLTPGVSHYAFHLLLGVGLERSATGGAARGMASMRPSPSAGLVEWQAVRLRAFGIAAENATRSRDTALSG